MLNIFDVRMQKLFVVILCLKVTSSGFGWYFQYPWSFGFVIPLLLMTVYIGIGLKRNDDDVTDEKFADTCYYLGFIFTITSIIFSLFDLPNIGTRIQDIAVRFGAAMVSTVFGLGVRVYLVSFKKDVADAIARSEDAVLDANRRFTERLSMAVDRLHGFEMQVADATKASVENVNLQIENLSKNHADKLTAFFEDLTERNKKAFTEALDEVESATERLATAVNGYSSGMRTNLMSIEAKVGVFTEAVTKRLKETTFPDDFFVRQLEGPLAQMRVSVGELSDEVKLVAEEVKTSTKSLSGALKKISEQSTKATDSLVIVQQLTAQQQAVLDSASGQVESLGQMTSTLATFQASLASTTTELKQSSSVSAGLSTRVGEAVSQIVSDRQSIDESLRTLIVQMERNASATQDVGKRIDADTAAMTNAVTLIGSKFEANATATEKTAAVLATKLDANVSATLEAAIALEVAAKSSQSVASRLDVMVASEVKSTIALDALGQQASAAIGKVEKATLQFRTMTQQMFNLDSTLRTKGSEFRQIIEHIKDIKLNTHIETSPSPLTSISTVDSPPMTYVLKPEVIEHVAPSVDPN